MTPDIRRSGPPGSGPPSSGPPGSGPPGSGPPGSGPPSSGPPSSGPPSSDLQRNAPPLTRRQAQIVEFLREYTTEHGISPTLEEIAGNFGVNKVTIFGHVAELERKGVLRRAARGVSRGLQLVTDDLDSTMVLPILGRIAAGAPIEAIEDPETLDLRDLIPPGREVYALRVQGESMIEDAIADGDLVLVERRQEARDGQTVVAVLPDGETTLKRFYREGDQIRLQPANHTMQPLIVSEVEIRGVVIGVVRRYPH